jgi:hypothetical protein
MLGRVWVGAVAYVREEARGRDETMVDSSTAAGAADGTGTTGVLKRMARERFENSMVVVFVCVLWLWCVYERVVCCCATPVD